MTQEIMKALDGEIFAVWFLIGAAFVFWMQAGFAMCEAGFTRAKIFVYPVNRVVKIRTGEEGFAALQDVE